MDSPQSQSQSSDEAKESDNSDHDKKNNNSDGNNKTSLKYTCDTCNVNVNSTTQLSQVKQLYFSLFYTVNVNFFF